MSIGASIFLIAVGAILEFAATVELLMVVGAIGLSISLLWAGRAAPWGTWCASATSSEVPTVRDSRGCRVAGTLAVISHDFLRTRRGSFPC